MVSLEMYGNIETRYVYIDLLSAGSEVCDNKLPSMCVSVESKTCCTLWRTAAQLSIMIHND